MTIRTLSKFAGAMALALTLPAMSAAQSTSFSGAPNLTLRRSNSHETWHTVLIVSGVLFIIGLADDDSTLTILGGAGVLVALSESNGTAFAFRSPRSFDLMKRGPVSLGLNPFGDLGMSQGLRLSRPSAVLQATFKF